MNTLGIIIARAGSAGLHNKHLLPLLGQPVIGYTFDHASASTRLTRIIVSSDAPEVLNLAAGHGFDTIARPARLATADASVQDVLLHALHLHEHAWNFRADAIILLYGNVPVRGPGVIDRAVELLESTGCDSVRSFCPVGKWHPAWMSRIEHDRVIPLEPGSIHLRQDLEPLYLHDGAVVAVSRASLLGALDRPQDPHAFFGADRRGIVTAPGETVEVDELRDLFLAEAILRHQRSAQPLRRAS
jgi:CMP-N,N'-diacetyllegionaminic acid synthase